MDGKAKLHFWHADAVACECHDVGAEDSTVSPERVTCLRCANTKAWREAMGLPAATTGSQASLICRSGRTVYFERHYIGDWKRGTRPTRFTLVSGGRVQRVLWAKNAEEKDEARIRELAKTWATEHGFNLR
jgi:hypothetical protein